jgi:hypothetical protein
VEGITLVFLALIAGVVLYLVLSQRSFQRVDYGHLLAQEERERQLITRLQQAEDLLLTIREYELSRRLELEQFVTATKRELVEEIAAARRSIVSEVLNRPGAYDQLLLADTGVLPAGKPQGGMPLTQPATRENANLVRFLHSPHQQRIAEMLECGFSHQEVSRELGVSRTEVELVSAIIFNEKSA